MWEWFPFKFPRAVSADLNRFLCFHMDIDPELSILTFGESQVEFGNPLENEPVPFHEDGKR